MEDDRVVCECGCDEFYVQANDPSPKKGICARCRKDVDLTGKQLELI